MTVYCAVKENLTLLDPGGLRPELRSGPHALRAHARGGDKSRRAWYTEHDSTGTLTRPVPPETVPHVSGVTAHFPQPCPQAPRNGGDGLHGIRVEMPEEQAMFSIDEIIALAVTIEQNGERVYREALKATHDPTLGSLLTWLVDEEVSHARWFSELREQVGTPGKDPRLEELGNSMLKSILGSQTFSLQETDFSQVESVKDLLEVAIEFEKDTVLFYQMLLALIDDEETRQHLSTIVEEEERHAAELEDFIKRGIISFEAKPHGSGTRDDPSPA